MDGRDYVFNWSSSRIQSETWPDYVKRTKDETIAAIHRLNTEQVVAEEFKENIFYNLVYTDEKGYDKLR